MENFDEAMELTNKLVDELLQTDNRVPSERREYVLNLLYIRQVHIMREKVGFVSIQGLGK